MSPDLLQWPGMVLSLLGAVFAASKDSAVRKVGYGVWLFANLIWITFALFTSAPGLAITYVIFFITSVVGFRNNR